MSVARRRPGSKEFSYSRMLETAIFIAIVFLALFVVVDLSSDEAEAVGGSNIVVWIELEEAYADVDVKPGSVPTAQFTGYVWARRDTGSGRIDVDLKAITSREGFYASVSPMQLSLDPPRIIGYKITLNVIAKLRANYTDVTRYPPVKVTVEGNWLSYPSGIRGQVANSTVMVTVNQFYDLTVSVDPPFFKGLPGESAWFDISIKNMGNGLDSFEVSIVNDQWYADMGFSFYAETWQIDVPANQNGIISLRVDSPYKISIYESSVYSITLKITSKGSKMYVNNQNPRSTIYDIVFHCKGAGILLYFPTECWAMFLMGAVFLAFVVYNLKVFRKGRKKGTKYPVRDHWKARADKFNKYRNKRKEKARERNELRELRRAEKKREKEEKQRLKDLEKKKDSKAAA